MEVFSAIGNHKCVLTIETGNCLIDGLCKIGRLKIAWYIFHMLMQNPGLTPDVVMYNIMIHGFCKEGQIQKANGLLLDMEEKGLEPNVVIFDTLMRGLIRNDEPSKVNELLHIMAEKKVAPDASIISLLLDLLAKDQISSKLLLSFPPLK